MRSLCSCSLCQFWRSSTQFSEFTPLTTSATPIPIGDPDEATPITFSNPHFSQRTLADRVTQNTLVPNSNSGSWDMVTSNETGPNAGRYLFMPFETGTAGVQRVDTQDPHYLTWTVTIVAPGTPVGAGLRNADNLAIDHEQNIYIIEDRSGGVDDDLWFAVDRNKDGDLLDKGEGLARWASNGTQGSEFTGLYFDLKHPNRAYVNIQHPASENDRLIEMSGSPQFQRGNKGE